MVAPTISTAYEDCLWALECARPGGREQMSPRLAEALDSLARVRSH